MAKMPKTVFLVIPYVMTDRADPSCGQFLSKGPDYDRSFVVPRTRQNSYYGPVQDDYDQFYEVFVLETDSLAFKYASLEELWEYRMTQNKLHDIEYQLGIA